MIYWIWLTQIDGIGPVTQRLLLDKFSAPKEIYSATYNDLIDCKGIGKDKATRIIKHRSLEESKRILRKTKELDIKLLTLHGDLYPKKAKEIYEMPILLYYKGNLIENSMGVSIVGARRCSNYGKELTIDIASSLAKNNIPVISGMAKGIDGYAHTACLKEGGFTIAFLGCGVDICYPAEHKSLMDEIITNGAVISEYPPGTRPNPIYFPRRNLLISAWSNKVLIIEAGLKSGSLITGDFGLKYNREVFAAPHNLDYEGGLGTNLLILNGATIFLKKEQLGIKKTIKKSNKISSEKISSSNEEGEILNILKTEGNTIIENLAKKTDLSKVKVLEILSLLELKGEIEIKGNIVTL